MFARCRPWRTVDQMFGHFLAYTPDAYVYVLPLTAAQYDEHAVAAGWLYFEAQHVAVS